MDSMALEHTLAANDIILIVAYLNQAGEALSFSWPFAYKLPEGTTHVACIEARIMSLDTLAVTPPHKEDPNRC